MTVLTRAELAGELRKVCDFVRTRLWIASPYIGSWAVRSVLGRKWWDNSSVDVRLLTDPDEQVVNRATASRFAERGQIKKLRGLHAKMYIIDECVLLTSANLTFAGFARRHEAGVILTGATASSAIAMFESWWESATDFPVSSVLELPRRHPGMAGEDYAPGLPDAVALPPDPGDFGSEAFGEMFGDYVEFLRCYRELVGIYSSTPRIWPEVPIYLETDAFLDYLFHHECQPSREYTKLPARKLQPSRRAAEIRYWAAKFQVWAATRDDDRRWRLSNAKDIHRLLSPRRRRHLTRPDIREVASRLNCMDNRVLSRFMEPKKNSTINIKKAWDLLLSSRRGNQSPTQEMAKCAGLLFGFKKSSIQELLGWYFPSKFPLRNANVDAGMKFLGYDVQSI